ncbi:putative reverse transcriptase domain-containing protein [Tanacetum coccineum]
METFISEFRTTNELLLKEQNNLLSELCIEVHGLSKIMNDVLILKNEVKGVTTREGRMATRIAYNNETNNINKEPSKLSHDKPEEPRDGILRDEPQKTKETIPQPLVEIQVPSIPFPHWLRKEKEEARQQKLKEACTVTMNERFSVVLLNKLPSKEKEPRSFTIPCHISDLHINNALAILGASISLMLYTMYGKLGLREPKPTRISLELADKSISYPRGIVENVLIKVDKFVFPIDFVILDMPEDSRILIIFGRPFLATAQAMIDVFNKKMMLRVGDDEVLENYKGAMAWKISDTKGISPSFFTHKILMEDDYKLVIQPQRRLNPKVQDVVKNEILKLLNSGFIYPIYNNSWDFSRFQLHPRIRKRQHLHVYTEHSLIEECPLVCAMPLQLSNDA